MTPDLLDLLTVEVLVPPVTTDAFVLDESALNITPLGARAEALAWQTIHAQARHITTRRGGTADKVTSAIEVGTLSVELVDPPNMRVRPSTRIRLRTTTGTSIFTGQVTDLHSSLLREVTGATVTVHTITTITAVDAVSQLANTNRYGAIADSIAGDDTPYSYEPFEQRIHRLLAHTGLPYHVAPNVPIEVDSQIGTTLPLTGPTQETILDVWRGGGSATRQAVSLRGSDSEIIAWLVWGMLPDGTTPTAGAYIARTIYGLAPGATYRIAVNRPAWTDGQRTERLGVGIVGIGYDPYTPRAGVPAYYEFVATATEHELMITNADPVTVAADDFLAITLNSADPWEDDYYVPATLTLWVHEQRMPRGQSWQCQSIVYESTLANHLDLAANTVRGRWWVDRDGTIQAAREGGWINPAVILTDNTADRPEALSYVGVARSFDTKRIVNTATIKNHGSQLDPQDGRRTATDATYTAVDVTSRATNGPRAAEVEASIYDPPIPESIYYGSGTDLARSYAAAFARADDRISSVRVRTSQHIDLITALDVYDPVTAENRSTITEARIIGIEHEITPEDWHTTLDLIERN